MLKARYAFPLLFGLIAQAKPAAIPLAALHALKGHFVTLPPRQMQILGNAFDEPDFGRGECRARIRSLMCRVDPVPVGEEGKARVCLEGGANYASTFESLYDAYPPALQRVFCSLRRIYIESGKEVFGTAYAGLAGEEKDGKFIPTGGSIMGVRQSVIDENLSLSTWATWKEQLSFGGHVNDYQATPGLPSIRASMNGALNDFLYLVIAHEFGHIFDFGNQLNRCGPTDGKDCPRAPGSWTELSWKNAQEPWFPLEGNDFENRADFCFYGCQGKISPPEHREALYAGLYKSNFISAYAATNPWDDFAESLAYHLSDRERGLSYRLDTGNGQAYDSVEKLHSERFAPKLDYVRKFLARDDIVYP